MTQENLLLISPIKPTQEHLFTDLGVHVYYPDDVDTNISPSQITILYGWENTIGNTILNAPNSELKWVHAISAGVDYLPLDTFRQRHIKLTNASGIHAEAISQSVLAYISYYVRGLNIANENKAHQHWAGRDEETPHVFGNFTYAIFGTGHIGQQIARLIHAFSGQTIGINTTGHPANYFDTTLAINALDNRVWSADVVINVMPLTESTHHFFNAKLFDRLESTFLFINVGRGPVVDSNALLAALNTHQVKYAALDVFEEEPLSKDSPFWHLENVIVTPHNTGIITHFKDAQVNLFLPNLRQFLKDGTFESNRVDLSKGY